MDCSLLANEAIDAMLKAERTRILCKVDIEKAYDHVNWGYLNWIQEHMGFGSKWRNWIKICVTSPSFFVLVNRSLKKNFKGSRGLRQGDLLSPCLFIMVANLVRRLSTRAAKVGLI